MNRLTGILGEAPTFRTTGTNRLAGLVEEKPKNRLAGLVEKPPKDKVPVRKPFRGAGAGMTYPYTPGEKDPITKSIEAGKAGIERVSADQSIADAYFSGRDITPFIKRKSAIDQIAPVEGSNFLSDTFYKGIGVAAPMVQSYWQASPLAAIGMVGGGIIGGIAGNIIGGPAPEELITVPAGAKVGLTAGTIFGGKAGVTAKSMEYWYRQGTGQMIHSMVKNGVDMKYAGPIAAIGGIPYAAIEFAQMSKLTPGLRQGVQDVAAKSMLRAFTNAAKKYGQTWAIENVEEVLQDGVQIAAEDIGNLFAGNDLKFDKKGFIERANRLAETAIQSGQAMLFLPLPGAVVDVRSGVMQVKERNKLKDSLQDKAKVSPKVAERAVEMLEEGWKPGEIDRLLIGPSKFIGDRAIDQVHVQERPITWEQIKADRQQEADIAEMNRELAEIQKATIMPPKAEPVKVKRIGELRPDTPEYYLVKVGQAQIKISEAIKKHGYGGITDKEQHPSLVAARKEKFEAMNELYDSLNPKYKIGDIFEDKGQKWKITQAHFDVSQSVDTLRKTGFPSTFRFSEIRTVRTDGKDTNVFFSQEKDWLQEIDTSQALRRVLEEPSYQKDIMPPTETTETPATRGIPSPTEAVAPLSVPEGVKLPAGAEIEVVEGKVSKVMPEHEYASPGIIKINSTIGEIRVPEVDLTGKYGDDLETVFYYGNFQSEKVEQPNLRRSLSVGDTIKYRSHTLMVMPQGWRDITGLSDDAIEAIATSENAIGLNASWRQGEKRLRDWKQRFREQSIKVATAEKPGPIITEQERKLSWQELSRRRGYTEAEIKDYQKRLDLIEEGKQLGLPEDEIFGLERKWTQEALKAQPTPEAPAALERNALQDVIDKGGERTVLAAQRAARKSGKNLFVYQKGKQWHLSKDSPKEGDYYTITPKGEVAFGKTAKDIKLTMGLDPGLDKFIAEDIKPTIAKAKKAGKSLKDIGLAVPKLFMKLIEPAKAAETKAGKEAYTATIRAIHKASDVAQVEWESQRNETMDMNMDQLKKWFEQFSEEENRDFLIANAGKPGTIEAEIIQREAKKRLPDALKQDVLVKAVREISERNYKALKSVAGENIGWVQDYFYGIYKNPGMVDRFFKYWKSTKRFTKHKVHPSLADAINYGVEPRHDNYIDNLRAEYMGIARLGAMKWLKKELLRTGEGRYIDNMMDAPTDWVSVKDPVFAPYLLKPELAELINNLISTNKITQQPVLNAFRKVGNTLRIVKFIGSIYHLRTEIKQAIADSGYLGFVHKKTALRGVQALGTSTKKEWAKLRQTPEYKRLLELGIGHRYSYEQQAQKQFKDFVDHINKGNFIGATFRGLKIPLKIPVKFTGWLFEQYIPMVKALKVMDAQMELEKKKGSPATDWEIINIIKETQNFYGEMNERLFGRSGTVTTGMRYIYLAPGFAEGNYRTILKSLFQWGQGEGWRAGRSRSNIVNSPFITLTIASIGTLLLTGKPPKKPETVEDIRDLFKIDTGKKDPHGRKVMIDMMTYDKDYWNIYFNVLRGRPDVAVYESLRRLGGMKSPMFDMMLDFARMSTGQAIYDWKGDRVTEITDTSLEKLMKIAIHEIKKTEPIPMSVYQQARKKEVGKIISFVEAVMGVRPTLTEKDKREGEILRRCHSLKGQKEEMYSSLATLDRPRGAVKWYNNKVKDVLESKLVPKSMKDEWIPKLTIDLEKYLQNKALDASRLPTTKESEEQIEKAVKILKNFDISPNAAEQLLIDYYNRPKTKVVVSPIERDRILGRARRKKRLKERMK